MRSSTSICDIDTSGSAHLKMGRQVCIAVRLTHDLTHLGKCKEGGSEIRSCAKVLGPSLVNLVPAQFRPNTRPRLLFSQFAATPTPTPTPTPPPAAAAAAAAAAATTTTMCYHSCCVWLQWQSKGMDKLSTLMGHTRGLLSALAAFMRGLMLHHPSHSPTERD